MTHGGARGWCLCASLARCCVHDGVEAVQAGLGALSSEEARWPEELSSHRCRFAAIHRKHRLREPDEEAETTHPLACGSEVRFQLFEVHRKTSRLYRAFSSSIWKVRNEETI